MAEINTGYGSPGQNIVANICFVGVALFLLLISLIDLKWQIIPDEATIMIALFGLGLTLISGSAVSFLGAGLAGISFWESPIINRLLALLVVLIILGGLIAVTRGQGMGMGDLKLALALALLIGWPDIFFTTITAFILGAIYGVGLIVFQKSSMRSAVPFGPFLALGFLVTFWWGDAIVSAYLGFLSGFVAV